MSCSTSSAAIVCGADAAFGERHVFRDRRVEVVTHHRHVEMLVEGVHRVGIGRIGRRRQAIGDAGDADDIGRMAAAGAFGVIHVDGAAADGGERVLDEAGFVERVGVQLHLKIEVVGDGETGVDRCRHRAPVFVNLQADAAGFQLLDERSGLVRIAAAEETEIDRPVLGGLQHLADIEGAAGIDADGDRAERAAEHRGNARRDRVLAQARPSRNARARRWRRAWRSCLRNRAPWSPPRRAGADRRRP